MLIGMIGGGIYWLRVGKKDEAVMKIYLAGLVSAFIGAKLAFLFAEGWLYWHHPQRWLVWLSGKSVMGALPGGWLGVELMKKKLGYRKITGDAFARLLPIPLALGRIGCLQAGCCQGIACSWGVWPAPAVEIGFQILALITLVILKRRRILPGQHFHLYLMAYGIFRFFHEFLRATPKPMLGLSGYQWLAACCAILAGFAFFRRSMNKSIQTHVLQP
jgi:phosphatidylglycerol---prolipoprotein diacylglyceryl transferase